MKREKKSRESACQHWSGVRRYVEEVNNGRKVASGKTNPKYLFVVS